jgi:hypothetical protein
MLTYHEPQMKYWRNMNAESLSFREVCMGWRRVSRWAMCQTGKSKLKVQKAGSFEL